MKTLARIVTRDSGDGSPDLIIGQCFKSNGVLKSNHVYVIEEVLGQITIRCIGPSRIKNSNKDGENVCWGNSVDFILCDKDILLTENEHQKNGV